jgi:two-component system, NtrC family, sensor kinase
MAMFRLRTVRSMLTSRLSRQLGLWVFGGILTVEAMIFLPSAYRRKYEQLEIIQMTASVTVNTLAALAPTSEGFIDRLISLSPNPPLAGTALYRGDGTLVQRSGAAIALPFESGRSLQNQLRYQSPWIYETAFPVTLQDGPHYLLLAYDARIVSEDLVAFSLRVLGLILLISISVTFLMMWMISRRLINPILLLRSDMLRSGQAIATGQSPTAFASQQYQRQNELLEVIQAFHQSHQQILGAIAERDRSEANLKQTQARLIHTEKMSSLGQLGAGFAHEINNPINFIDANLKHIGTYGQDLLATIAQYQQELPQPSIALQAQVDAIDLEFIQADMPKILQSMQSGSTRIRDLVVSFRNFVRLDEADQKAVDLHEGLDSCLLLLQSRLLPTSARPAIIVQRHYGELPPVECYPKQLNQVFMSLITNAIEALDHLRSVGDHRQAGDAPQITITTAQQADGIIIQITDNGIGIPPTIQSKIFDPFFTTKDVGQGMGLGLTNSYQIIQASHHGRLEFTCTTYGDRPTTTFTIWLPASPQIDPPSKPTRFIG